MTHLRLYEKTSIAGYVSAREGETKLGEAVHLPSGNLARTLQDTKKNGARFVVLGVPEDIGVRGNFGRSGTEKAWEAFLKAFLNVQANDFIDASKILLLGHIEVEDLMKQSPGAPLDRLRELCGEVDARLAPVIEAITAAGLEPITVGGGHNNAYPMIKGAAKGLRADGIACVNCDPHMDFRVLEGRHSGNGFTYAHAEGLLKGYYVFGLHESYNSKDMLARFRAAGFRWSVFEDMKIRKGSLPQALEEVADFAKSSKFPVGIELDMDSITAMPSSARTPAGLTLEEAAMFVHAAASAPKACYLHLPEAAPALGEDGERMAGRALSLLALTYIKARCGGSEK